MRKKIGSRISKLLSIIKFSREEYELFKIANQKQALESKIKIIKERFPSVDLSGIESLSNIGLKIEIVNWLISKYVRPSTSESLVSIEQAISALLDYSKNKTRIMNRWQTGFKNLTEDVPAGLLENDGGRLVKYLIKLPEFSNLIEDTGDLVNDLKNSRINVSSLQNLNYNQIAQLNHWATHSLKSEKVSRTTIDPKEKIGKVDQWNVWLPHTQETSNLIAGVDEQKGEGGETIYKEKTTWCTARITGSNLFYKYTASKKPDYVFYIIKDDPKQDEDWLAIAFIGEVGKPETFKTEFPTKEGEGFGGKYVDRANEGLTEARFRKILGDSNADQILNLIKNHINDLGGKIPSSEKINLLANDTNELQQTYRNKSQSERRDLTRTLLDQNPSDSVKEYMKKYLRSYDLLGYLQIFNLSDDPPITEHEIISFYNQKNSVETTSFVIRTLFDSNNGITEEAKNKIIDLLQSKDLLFYFNFVYPHTSLLPNLKNYTTYLKSSDKEFIIKLSNLLRHDVFLKALEDVSGLKKYIEDEFFKIDLKKESKEIGRLASSNFTYSLLVESINKKEFSEDNITLSEFMKIAIYHPRGDLKDRIRRDILVDIIRKDLLKAEGNRYIASRSQLIYVVENTDLSIVSEAASNIENIPSDIREELNNMKVMNEYDLVGQILYKAKQNGTLSPEDIGIINKFSPDGWFAQDSRYFKQLLEISNITETNNLVFSIGQRYINKTGGAKDFLLNFYNLIKDDNIKLRLHRLAAEKLLSEDQDSFFELGLNRFYPQLVPAGIEMTTREYFGDEQYKDPAKAAETTRYGEFYLQECIKSGNITSFTLLDIVGTPALHSVYLNEVQNIIDGDRSSIFDVEFLRYLFSSQLYKNPNAYPFAIQVAKMVAEKSLSGIGGVVGGLLDPIFFKTEIGKDQALYQERIKIYNYLTAEYPETTPEQLDEIKKVLNLTDSDLGVQSNSENVNQSTSATDNVTANLVKLINTFKKLGFRKEAQKISKILFSI